jgi:hypothetical protein
MPLMAMATVDTAPTAPGVHITGTARTVLAVRITGTTRTAMAVHITGTARTALAIRITGTTIHIPTAMVLAAIPIIALHTIGVVDGGSSG